MRARIRQLLRRPPEAAPRAYWVARSRFAEGIAALRSRVLARRIARALAGRPDVRFAQVGANDGRRGDPLRGLVLGNPGWSGVFAEPVPGLFGRLVRSYPSEPRLHFQPVAVADAAGHCLVYAVGADAEAALAGRLPSWTDQIASLDPEHLVAHLGERIRPFLVAHEVECVTLPGLLSRVGLAELDLLHVDAEGADARVLRQLDLSTHRPRVVLYEHVHLAAAEARDLEERLRGAGYRLSRHGGDTLALASPR